MLLNFGLSGVILYHLIKLRKELRGKSMNQQRLDDLAQQLENGNLSAIQAGGREKLQVAEAINNPNLDTSRIEAAIAVNAGLAALFEGIYTPPATAEPSPTETTEGGATETGTTGGGETAPTENVEAPASETPAPADTGEFTETPTQEFPATSDVEDDETFSDTESGADETNSENAESSDSRFNG